MSISRVDYIGYSRLNALYLFLIKHDVQKSKVLCSTIRPTDFYVTGPATFSAVWTSLQCLVADNQVLYRVMF